MPKLDSTEIFLDNTSLTLDWTCVTYFVDATNGLDSNAGTSELLPWQNLSKIRTEMGVLIFDGDTINFKRGEVWVDQLQTVIDGGITLDAYSTGARPRFYTAPVVSGWTLESGSRYQATFAGSAYAAQAMLWEETSGGVITQGTRQPDLVSVVAPGDFFYDFAINTLYYIATDSADPDTHTIRFNNVNTTVFRIDDGNGIVRHLELFMATAACMTNEFNVPAGGWVLEDTRFAYSRIHGFQQFGGTAGSSFTFTRCEFDHNGQWGCILDAGVVNSLLDECDAHDNGIGVSASGILVRASAPNSGNVIRRCRGWQNSSNGIDVSAPATPGDGDDVIELCQAWENGNQFDDRSGIGTFGERTIIRYNRSWDNNLSFITGHGIILDVGSLDCVVHHNVCYGNTNGGIAHTGTGHSFHHNTCYGNLCNSAGGQIVAFGGLNAIDNCQYRNNIYMTTTATQSAFRIPAATASAGVTANFNLYFAGAAKPANWIDWQASGSFTTVAAFNASTGQEANGIEADPLFAAPAEANFHLRVFSPGIDQGTDLGYTTDIEGRTIVPPPNMGAFERSAAIGGGSTKRLLRMRKV